MYKIMWLPGEGALIWKLINEEPLWNTDPLFLELSKIINLDEWINLYSFKYQDWLANDNRDVYDINSTLNQGMLKAIMRLNIFHGEVFLYYWFDVDRSVEKDFKWIHCPVSKRRLINLGTNYPLINRLISPEFPLVFPQEA